MSLDKFKEWMLVTGPALCLVIFGLFALWLGHASEDARFAVSFPPLPDISIDVPPIQQTLKIQDAGIGHLAVQGLPDPFGRQPSVIKTEARVQPILQELSLSLVVIANGERYCHVNGRFLREGEKAAGFAVRKVEQSGVLFDTDAGRIFLKPGQKENLVLKPANEPDSSLHDTQPDSHKDKENA
ncbi:MAG: hypothetical protein ACUVQ6_00730 [Dissulfurimicrobium sp.]|uniref:hypothetical protein n=1 Tax=Dissulfurimicrobium sp. TaxID=2022436 RepID=UPI0040490FB3